MAKELSKIKFTIQPSGLFILFFAELWDRFSFYGTSSLLILYLTKVFLLSDSKANDFYGAYSALGFALPVIGGWLADKWLGFKQAVTLGASLNILGNLLLMIPVHFCMYLGFATALTGVGLFKGNAVSLVNTLYEPHDLRRDTGYTIFYMGMNAGAILGPIICGIAAAKYGWHAAFLLNALVMLLGLIVFLVNYKRFNDTRPTKQFSLQKNHWQTLSIYLLVILGIILFTCLFHYPALANTLIGLFSLLALLTLAIIAYSRPALERKRIIALALLILFSVFYFACSIQTGSSVMLFIDRYVNHSLAGINLPPPSFLSLEPLSVIVLTPLFAVLWIYLAKRSLISFPMRVLLALLFASASFVAFALASAEIHFNNRGYPLFWIIIANLLLGAGELCVGPLIFTAVARYAPVDLLGTLMGFSFMSNALAGYLGSLLAKLSNPATSHFAGVTAYTHAFTIIVVIMLGISLLTLMIIPVINRLLADKADNDLAPSTKG